MPEDVITRFNAELSEASQLAIALAIATACRESVADTKKRHSAGFPLAHAIGQDRYYQVQDRLLQLDLPNLSCRSEKHPRGSTFFTAMEGSGLRMTATKLNSRMEIPAPTLFRITEQARQLAFAFDEKLNAEISFGVSEQNIAELSFIDVRFQDGHGGYLEDFIDMLALLKRPIPVEEIPDERGTTLREFKIRKPKRDA